MTSFIRISDIPPDELHLLPIIGLRQQIREDGNRLSLPSSWIHEEKADGSLPGRGHHTQAPAAEVLPATEESFVTDWQLDDEPEPRSRPRIDRKDIDGDEDPDGEGFDDEDFDDEVGGGGEEEERSYANEIHDPSATSDALYVDIGGEG
jgi:hypothetical protein